MNLLLLIFFALISSSYCDYGITNRYQRPVLNNPKAIYQWKKLEFGFPNTRAKQQAEASGNLIPTNTIPIDVQPHYYNKKDLRTFVTIPRFNDGVPYTLVTISNRTGPNGPILEPYPNYEAHDRRRNCDAIHSAFRVAITECNQMWVIDSGFYTAEAECPPQLLLFDLNTDQLIHRYQFPKNVYTPGASLFILPVANVKDPRDSCIRTMVYVADVNNHGLVVYDYQQNTTWRIDNLFLYPDPNHGILTLAGEKFVLMDGIFGMATDKQNLYFHPLASVTEYAVPLKIIDNSTFVANNADKLYKLFRPLGKRSSQCVASAMDSNKNLYCVTLNPIELIKWNVNTSYDKSNIKKLSINPEEVQFVSGMKVIRNNEGNEELWMISNKFQNMAVGKQNFNEVNFRILVRSLADASASSQYDENDDLINEIDFWN